jgi:plastocyanin
MPLLGDAGRAFAAGLVACCVVYAALAEPGETRVAIDNFTFKPATITVRAGTRIVWQNDDDIPHSLVETQGKFHSGARHRRPVRLHLRRTRDIRVFLRPAPAHDRQGCGHAVKSRWPRAHLSQ